MKLYCQHADTCLPDFWSGHHLPHVGIMALPHMSFKQVRDAIRDEIRMGYVMGNGEDARLLSADMVKPEDEKRADALTRAAYAAINRDVKPAKKGARRAFPDVELSEDDNGDCVMAYFVFVIED